MAEVTGPISTLPGHSHDLPNGTPCDWHADRPAVARIQGETDSFGCEMNDMCQECLDEYREQMRAPDANAGRCDWCRNEVSDLRETRDYEEGLCGPVYRVCAACRKRRDDRAEQDLAAHDDAYWDYDDRDDEPYDPAEDCGRTDDGTCMNAGSEWCDFECPYRNLLDDASEPGCAGSGSQA